MLKQYLYVFEENKIPTKKGEFGNFSFVNEVFQKCYLGNKSTKAYFENLINNKDSGRAKNTDHSRYIFFYINYLIENNKHQDAKEISTNLEYLKSSLLISQGKKWIEDEKQEEFQKVF